MEFIWLLIIIAVVLAVLIKSRSLITGGNQHYHEITIQNPPETPWLDWIESGKKQYEGRLFRRKFTQIAPGDKIRWIVPGKSVLTTVVSLHHFRDFAEAFNELGNKLVPSATSADVVTSLYRNYFSDAEVAKFGVIAIKLKVI